MTDLQWIKREVLILLHSDTIKIHGGLDGILDQGLLDSALARPRNINYYKNETDIAKLAAAYSVGIIQNHSFIDGNKRAGFLAIGLFLRINGFRLVASPKEATKIMELVAKKELTESELVVGIKNNLKAD